MSKAKEKNFALKNIHEEQHIAREPLPEPANNDQLESSTARPTRIRCAQKIQYLVFY